MPVLGLVRGWRRYVTAALAAVLAVAGLVLTLQPSATAQESKQVWTGTTSQGLAVAFVVATGSRGSYVLEVEEDIAIRCPIDHTVQEWGMIFEGPNPISNDHFSYVGGSPNSISGFAGLFTGASSARGVSSLVAPSFVRPYDTTQTQVCSAGRVTWTAAPKTGSARASVPRLSHTLVVKRQRDGRWATTTRQ